MSLAASVFVTIALYIFSVPKSLGAHPWWAENVIFYGAPIGMLIGLVVAFIRPRSALVSIAFFILTLLAFWVAKSGGTAFAASFAEDQAAGQRWFYGWIATIAALLAAVSYTSKR